MNEVIKHYDMLIEEGNDPVYDPPLLSEYMDKWDGEAFIDAMRLDRTKSVLEIGIGTGRIALRVAPLCGKLCGIDISKKTVDKACHNLSRFSNVSLVCDDFMNHDFKENFDVIYSTLTFMHLSDKSSAIYKVSSLLRNKGIFALSIDKNKNDHIDMGTRRIKIYPDDPDDIRIAIGNCGLVITKSFETDMAYIFISEKISDLSVTQKHNKCTE